MSPEYEPVSHRTHPLRRVQNAFEGSIERIMQRLYNHGQLTDTQLEDVFRNGQELLPNDLTLAGVEFTVKAAKKQVERGLNWYLLKRFLLGGIMDASDGTQARHLKLQSPEGAVDDVAADRAGENYIAALIAETRARYPNCPPNLDRELRVAFQLSTLTKAASEMAGVHTTEGGISGMIRRRVELYLILVNLGKLDQLTTEEKLTAKRESDLLRTIDDRNQLLIQNSHKGAGERAELIRQSNASTGYDWNNSALDNPYSSAAVEARKYVAVIEIVRAMWGIDMVDYLNDLNEGVTFPQPKDLMERYPYIAECLINTQPFIEKIMAVVYENS